MRRVLALTALAGLCLAGLVQPAAGQTATTVRITNFGTRCADPGDNFDLAVDGLSNQASVTVVLYSPGGAILGRTGAKTIDGRWSTSLVWNYSETGSYEMRATVSGASSSAFLQVPCRPPALEFDPACFTSTTRSVRMTGRLFQPFGDGAFDLDLDGADAFRLPIDGRGTFTAIVEMTPRSGPRSARASDSRQNFADATWSECKPATTTSTSPSTTNTTERPTTLVSEPTTTITVVDPPGPPVTIPPAVELPPETPGATLIVSPKLGPTGFVTGAAGTGFPPGPVELAWEPGIGRTTTVVGPDGRFSVRVLVLPNDRIGSRALVATAGGTTAFDTFLVVPSTVQPSGQDVAQINRIRRFNSR